MRIHYDGMIYLLQSAGGINRYFANLITRLPDDVSPIVTTYQVRDGNLPTHPNLRVINYKRFHPGIVCSALRPLYFSAVNVSQKYEIAHPTYYSLLSGNSFSRYRCPIVITVYDMILERFAEQLDPNGSNAEAKRKAIAAAQAVICISENTKKDLLERYRIPEDRITVTYLASELDPNLATDTGQIPERPYFLHVGGRTGYKNFDMFLASFAAVASAHGDVSLCIVGPPYTDNERMRISELKLDTRIEHYGYVHDSQLARLYSHCIAFVYPSLYEGFGIPPLEAMSCGAPVIASNSSSIPEVVGDAALLFDPKLQDELTDMLLLLLESPSVRESLIAKGLQRSRLFSWDRTVAQTMDVYRSLAK